MDNTSSGFSSFTSGGINKYNQKPEWAVSNSDEPQTLKASGTYELPIGPGKKYVNNHITGNILGGWQVGWILDYEAGSATMRRRLCNGGIQESGNPYPGIPNGASSVVLRPDRVPSVGISTASYNRARDFFTGKASAAQIFNPAGFKATPSQYVSAMPRGTIRNFVAPRSTTKM